MTLDALKFKIQDMYSFKYDKEIKIERRHVLNLKFQRINSY
jgi:hypothetical protein